MRLDVVIPAHNQERGIDGALGGYRQRFAGPAARFLVALDGCTDGTAQRVRAHRAIDPRVELLEFPRIGTGGVLLEALRRCDADLVGMVDARGTAPGELDRLVDAARGHHGAIASRYPPRLVPAVGAVRWRATGRGIGFALRRLLRGRRSDAPYGAKVLRHEALAEMLPVLTPRDLASDRDLLVVARQLGFRIVEVPTA